MRLLLLLLLGFTAQLISAQASDLEININGIKSDKGNIYVGIFTEQNFLRKPLKSESIEVFEVGEVTSIVVKDLAHGNYAISLYQDLNGNNKFDTDEYGRPIEPWAMTGTNAKDQPPIWDLAKFKFDASTSAVNVDF